MSRAEFERARTWQPKPTDAASVRYDRKSDRVMITLRNDFVLGVPRERIPEFAEATPTMMMRVTVQPGGEAISLRSINMDVSVAGILADELSPIVGRANGRKGQGKTSALKVAAARKNGRKGGRPTKAARSQPSSQGK
jgi:hypothetical protein